MLPQDPIAAGAAAVLRKLQRAGYEAYIVGGAVRDLLLDLRPKDYDIATNATPEQIKSLFGRRAHIIGRRFRLVHVFSEHATYEVSTFRREPTLEERRGRGTDDGVIVWRDNEYGTLEQDARRRDFTCNALYFDPCGTGEPLQDFVGGLDDLHASTVRTIGPPATRMAEDPVRMLRACKLVGQYGFHMEAGLSDAVRELAPQLALSSRARLLEELYKILKKPYAEATFACCHDYGVLAQLLPELDSLWDQPAGRFARHLLAARDRRLASGDLFPSRVTGLAVLLLPCISAEFGNPDEGPLWENVTGIDQAVHARIGAFLSPYQMPREMVAKVRETLLMQPKFLAGRNRKRLYNHPLYARARDVFGLLVEAAGLDAELAAQWPEPEPRQRSMIESS